MIGNEDKTCLEEGIHCFCEEQCNCFPIAKVAAQKKHRITCRVRDCGVRKHLTLIHWAPLHRFREWVCSKHYAEDCQRFLRKAPVHDPSIPEAPIKCAQSTSCAEHFKREFNTYKKNYKFVSTEDRLKDMADKLKCSSEDVNKHLLNKLHDIAELEKELASLKVAEPEKELGPKPMWSDHNLIARMRAAHPDSPAVESLSKLWWEWDLKDIQNPPPSRWDEVQDLMGKISALCTKKGLTFYCFGDTFIVTAYQLYKEPGLWF